MAKWLRERESRINQEPIKYNIFRDPYFFTLPWWGWHRADLKNNPSLFLLRAFFKGDWYRATSPLRSSSVTSFCLLLLCWLLRVENFSRYIFFGCQLTLPTRFTRHFRCFLFPLRHWCISFFWNSRTYTASQRSIYNKMFIIIIIIIMSSR